jgi:hypothetical protein
LIQGPHIANPAACGFFSPVFSCRFPIRFTSLKNITKNEEKNVRPQQSVDMHG